MSQVSFASLGLSPLFLPALAERGISGPTEIQRRVIPRLLAGESFIFRSATGTGKTFAFLLPLLERLTSLVKEDESLRGRPLLLIAAPTYELCSQIKSEADFLLAAVPASAEEEKPGGKRLRAALLIGSVPAGRQIETLKRERPEVIVGNPGRILTLARMRKLTLKSIRFLVLDEADRLVQDELLNETEAMVSLLKAPFTGTACSATIQEKSRSRLLPLLRLADDNAQEGNLEEDTSGNVLRDKVEHWAFFSPGREKPELLRSLLSALMAGGKKAAGKAAFSKALIFTSRAKEAETIAGRLKHRKLPVAFLSGNMDNTRRKEALDAFKSGAARFLVSSDLAARGLDIAGISHVIALDVSEDRDVYLHRAGRTARAGKSGVMISIGTEGEMRRLAALEKALRIVVYPKELYGGKILKPEEEED